MLNVSLRTLIMYLSTITAMRLMGKRQIGELQPSELVTTLLISNLASLPIEENDISLLTGLVPIAIIIAVEIIFSVIEVKSSGFSKLVTGESKVLIKDGKVNQKMLKALRYNITDLLSGLRAKDVFDLNDVEFGIIETNGLINVYKKTEDGAQPLVPVILDGRTNRSGLKYCEKNEDDIQQFLRDRSLKKKDVLLLSLDNGGKYNLIVKE